MKGYFDFTQTSLWVACALITFCPLFWNTVARHEHKTRKLTALMGSKHFACYLFSATVFALGLVRDAAFMQAVLEQPKCARMQTTAVRLAAFACAVVGGVLVATSMLALGVTGTYLGDYFGILKRTRVAGFPFSAVTNPMYHGSALLFLAHALHSASPAGVMLAALVWFCYLVAVQFEEPFTTRIYAAAKTVDQL